MTPFLDILDQAFDELPSASRIFAFNETSNQLLVQSLAVPKRNKYGVLEKEQSREEIFNRVATCVAMMENIDNSSMKLRDFIRSDLRSCRFMFDETILGVLGADIVAGEDPRRFLLDDGWWSKEDLKNLSDLKKSSLKFNRSFLVGQQIFLSNEEMEKLVLDNNSEYLTSEVRKHASEKHLKIIFEAADAPRKILNFIILFIRKLCISYKITQPMILSFESTDVDLPTILNGLIYDNLRLEVRCDVAKPFYGIDSFTLKDLFLFATGGKEPDFKRKISFAFYNSGDANRMRFLKNYSGAITGYINLGAFVKENLPENRMYFDRIEFAMQIRRAVRYLNIINNYRDHEACVYDSYQNISLGIVGFAETCIKLGFGYISSESFQLASTLAGILEGAVIYSNCLEEAADQLCLHEVAEEFEDLRKEYNPSKDEDCLKFLESIMDNDGPVNHKDHFIRSRYINGLRSALAISANYFQDNTEGVKFYLKRVSEDKALRRKWSDFVSRVLKGMVKNYSIFSLVDNPFISAVMGATSTVNPIPFAIKVNPENPPHYWCHSLIRSTDLSAFNPETGEGLSPKWQDQNHIQSFDQIMPISEFAGIVTGTCDPVLNLTPDMYNEMFVTCFLRIVQCNIPGIQVYQSERMEKKEVPQQEFEEEKQEETEVPCFKPVQNDNRPVVLPGYTIKTDTPFGNIYLTANVEDGKIAELFIKIGKSGSDVRAFTESIGRLIGLCVQNGVPIEKCIQALTGISGHEIWVYDDRNNNEHVVRSIPDIVAHILQDIVQNILPKSAGNDVVED